MSKPESPEDRVRAKVESIGRDEARRRIEAFCAEPDPAPEPQCCCLEFWKSHPPDCPRVMAGLEKAGADPAPEPLRRLAEEWLEHYSDARARGGMTPEQARLSLTRLLERVVRDTAAAVLTAYPCSCAPDYTERGMTAPDCFRCVALEAGAEKALDAWGLE